MTRFDCKSKLYIKPFLNDRTLAIVLSHRYHPPYKDIRMSPEALNFVNQRVAFQTPSEIFQNLQISGLPRIEHIVQHQIYYQWQQENKRHWRYDDDQFASGTMLLDKLRENYRHKTITNSNIRALAIYISASINELSKEIKEIVIDATFGSNSAGMLLFGVLAEFDGTGVPVAYLFVEKDTSAGTAPIGAMTIILDQFLRPLLESGLNPSFVGCDKDKSEINAVQQVWPSAKVQLCFWHAKRAIQAKLKDTSKTDPLAYYTPGEAQALVPSLEICWGSYPIRRPDRNHRYGN